MWTWSISATGPKASVLSSLAAQECPTNDDGSPKSDATQALYTQSKDDVITKILALADGTYVEVSVSGNETVASPSVRMRQMTGPFAGQMVDA